MNAYPRRKHIHVLYDVYCISILVGGNQHSSHLIRKTKDDLEKMMIISEPIDEDDDELFKNSKTYSAAHDDDDDTKLYTH